MSCTPVRYVVQHDNEQCQLTEMRHGLRFNDGSRNNNFVLG